MLGDLRLLLCDTIVPGQEGGAYDAERLAWLEAELTSAPEAPTLIAMHHPPIRTGIPAFDEIGLPDADRRAFAELVAGHSPGAADRRRAHPSGDRGRGRRASGARRAEHLRADRARPRAGRDPRHGRPPGFVVHLLIDGEITSHVQPLATGAPVGVRPGGAPCRPGAPSDLARARSASSSTCGVLVAQRRLPVPGGRAAGVLGRSASRSSLGRLRSRPRVVLAASP